MTRRAGRPGQEGVVEGQGHMRRNWKEHKKQENPGSYPGHRIRNNRILDLGVEWTVTGPKVHLDEVCSNETSVRGNRVWNI